MPKMNVVTSLICRKILGDNPASNQAHPRHEGMSMDDMKQNQTTSAIIIGEHNPQCSIDTVESATSILMLYGNLIAGVIGAITAPFWGKLSDKYGRVKPLAAASTIILGSEVIFVLIAKLPEAISLNWIFLAWTLEGIRCAQFKFMCEIEITSSQWNLHSHHGTCILLRRRLF